MQLLEIEKELSGGRSEEALARYDAILRGLEERIADALREGLPPDDFSRVGQLREANTLARKLLRISAGKTGR
ncbi:MAG: hypothetical protein IKC80_02690 [Kiritimatiellae bacterium]|nr:hypothetical protein [Kiritimatiellia bacterium]